MKNRKSTYIRKHLRSITQEIKNSYKYLSKQKDFSSYNLKDIPYGFRDRSVCLQAVLNDIYNMHYVPYGLRTDEFIFEVYHRLIKKKYSYLNKYGKQSLMAELEELAKELMYN